MTDVDDRRDGTDRARDYRALVDYGLAAGIGLGHSLGLRLESLGAGRSVWSLTPSARAADARYTLAGGVLAALMEVAMSSAVQAGLPPRTTQTTSQLSTSFVGSVRVDDPQVCCEARVLHLGGRTATAEARVLASDGTLVAHGSATCLLFAIPSGAAPE
ncbi:PaaI family thioesterase [Actinomycetospora chiangmaiensis]|uniref:PaaI family thioesterase n=1 Tax=Actinomycetospora chiangmaiensis TaxID=402650 RepID=UPI00036FAE1E|nr:PaaI family thioesterase [Actinomycetospora chiangmaiensis]